MRRKKKFDAHRRTGWAAVLDFDGTLLPKPNRSVFNLIIESGGLSDRAIADLAEIKGHFVPLATAGLMTPKDEVDWLRREVDVWVRDGFGPKQAAAAMATADLRPMATECLAWLKRRGIPTAIVSYGIRPFILMILHDFGLADLIDRVYALDLKLDYARGRYSGLIAQTMVVPSNKGLWSRRFARNHGVGLDRILAVGDTLGDRYLGHLKENRFGLALDDMDRERLEPHFGQVAVTESFLPAWRWMKRKTK